MEHENPDDAAVDSVAAPAFFPQQRGESVPAVVLDVAGEVFELRADEGHGTNYLWLAGTRPTTGGGTTDTVTAGTA